MNSHKLSILFKQFNCNIKNMQKIVVANSCLNISKGQRNVTKARKYRRPEDLEDPYYYGIGPKPEVTATCQSIAARGFAKERPSYQPPANVEEKLEKICKKVFGSQLNSSWMDQSLDEPLLKYKVLTKCIGTFKQNVPSSYLHTMKTVEDILTYFKTPVDGSLHYDALLRDQEKLPPNLHLIRESPTFNPATDTFFDGITAFPDRKRIIHTKTGQKFERTIEWPHI